MKNMTQICHIVYLFYTFLALSACSPSTQQYKDNYINASPRSSQIINGEEVPANDLVNQHTVFIFDSETNLTCTGVIIASNIILTAAHCIKNDPEYYQVYFSNKILDTHSVEKRDVLKIEQHADYAVRQFMSIDHSDIALIQIRGEIPAQYKPVPLLQNYQSLLPNTEIIVAGYGAHELPAIEDEADSEGVLALAPTKKFVFKRTPTLRKSTLQIANPQYGQTEASVDQTNKQGVCFGDSGGPAFIENNGQLILWGITSRGSNKCRSHSYFTKLDTHLPWIFDFISNSPVDNSQSLEEILTTNDDLLDL